MADRIISYLEANDIPYDSSENTTTFCVSNKNKKVSIYYYKNNFMFYIDQKNYRGQPHIIKHWNLQNDLSKYGLCLTMDGSDWRSNTLNAKDEIKRVKEIVFELWDDPIGERFREINVLYQSQEQLKFYLNNKNQLKNTLSHLLEFNSVGYVNLQFKGETKEEILNSPEIVNSKFEIYLLSIHYKEKTKKLLLLKNKFFKINDFTDSSFWARIDTMKIQENIKLIGLGSIGGLVLDFLCKNNCKNISLYDYDKMDVVNNPRHVLGIGPQKIGINKVEHLFSHYSTLFPMLNIYHFFRKFNYLNEEIGENDIIFNTTGGPVSKIMSNIKAIYKKNKKSFTYVDIFIEPFALGAHAIVFNVKKESFDVQMLKNCEKDERYIVTNEKDFRINFDGCFMPTLLYGFAPLQISVPLFLLTMIKNNFANNHYTIPFLSLVNYDPNVLNKKLSKKIKPKKMEVKTWEQ